MKNSTLKPYRNMGSRRLSLLRAIRVLWLVTGHVAHGGRESLWAKHRRNIHHLTHIHGFSHMIILPARKDGFTTYVLKKKTLAMAEHCLSSLT